MCYNAVIHTRFQQLSSELVKGLINTAIKFTHHSNVNISVSNKNIFRNKILATLKYTLKKDTDLVTYQ